MNKTDKQSGWSCPSCGYIFTPGTANPGAQEIDPVKYFEKLPDDWSCPECGSPKHRFKKRKHPKDEKEK